MSIVSLYDYLGSAAGAALGLQIACIAKKEHIQVVSRIVKTKKYTGEVNVYPVDFLIKVLSREGEISLHYKQKYPELCQ